MGHITYSTHNRIPAKSKENDWKALGKLCTIFWKTSSFWSYCLLASVMFGELSPNAYVPNKLSVCKITAGYSFNVFSMAFENVFNHISKQFHSSEKSIRLSSQIDLDKATRNMPHCPPPIGWNPKSINQWNYIIQTVLKAFTSCQIPVPRSARRCATSCWIQVSRSMQNYFISVLGLYSVRHERV